MLYEVITLVAGAQGPRADPRLLPAAGLPRPLRQRHRLGRGRAAERQEGRGHAVSQPRITSYNVCYTKLLRVILSKIKTI